MSNTGVAEVELAQLKQSVRVMCCADHPSLPPSEKGCHVARRKACKEAIVMAEQDQSGGG